MTTQPIRRLHRRFVTASVAMLVASVAEFVLSRFDGPVFYLAAVPVVTIAVCGLILARTGARMEQQPKVSATRDDWASVGRTSGRVRWTSIERGGVPVSTHPNDCTVCGQWHGFGVTSPCHECHLAEVAAERAAQAALRTARYGH